MNTRKLGILLLIPAVGLIARSHARERAWARGEAGEPGHGPGPFGHGARSFGRGGFPAGFAGRGGFRMGGQGRIPPMIEAMLDQWHAGAHADEIARL